MIGCSAAYTSGTSGLTIAADRNLRRIRSLVLRQRSECFVDQFNGFGIAHVIAGIPGIEHALIGMLEKEIGREHRVAVVGAAHGLIPGVLHQAVALVHQDDR